MTQLLKMIDISKSFSGNQVLHSVKLDVRAGEVHALLGENGAGKSTLIKILGGAYSKDSGEIIVEGETITINGVESAKKHGIRVIHQELMLIPHMSIAENIFIGQEPKNALGLVDINKMVEHTAGFMGAMGLDLDPRCLVSKLNIAQQQMIEISRAIFFGAKIIVMDEPTSSLTDGEVEVLFRSIRRLKEKGVGIIYISHRMSELDEITDRITIMRDGHYIDTVVTKETDHDQLVALMVGRQLGDLYKKNNHASDEVVLKVEHLKSGEQVCDVSFDLKKGEVLGFSGLVGSGRSEAMTCIFGLRKKEHGTISINGKQVVINSVKDAMDAGIGLVPEDRKKEGIFPVQGIRFNTTIEILGEFLKNGQLNSRKENELTKKYVDDIMMTKYAHLEQPIAKLSGGNQQKIIISRWLLVTRSILILDEPTRGIDVKTKSDIYHLIDDLTSKGLSIIFISSEMPELINMCDRIVVMSHGHTAGILNRDEFTQERIMALATKEIGGE
ncbi:MAG: sugar ABC transporter ATP-binding protein [Lachnospiraceae bacterium]